MSEIDLNKIENSSINENEEWKKQSLINDIKKANFFIDYFKKKSDSRYQEVSELYNKLTTEINEAVKDNKLETSNNLEELKLSINKKSEIDKIREITEKLDNLYKNDDFTNHDILSRLDFKKLDNDEKQKLYFEMKNNILMISYINDENIINDFFNFNKGNNLSEYYKYCKNFIITNNSIINSYIKNTSQINMNLIPDSYFTYKIEGINNIVNLTNEIIKGNQTKLELRIRTLLLRLNGNNDNLKDCLNILLQNEITKNLIIENLPIEIINNNEIVKFLNEKGIDINNNIDTDKEFTFNELSNKILSLNNKDINYEKDYNLLSNKLDKFINKNGVTDMNLFIKIISKDLSKIEKYSCIIYNKEIALELVKNNPGIFINLSNKLRNDEDIIKNTIKDSSSLGYAYFINIDSTEVLINSYNLLKKLGIDDITIFNFPNFINGVKEHASEGVILGYEMRYNGTKNQDDYNLITKIKEIKNIEEKQRNSFSEVLKGVELILNNDYKNDFKDIVFKNLNNDELANKFIEILYRNKEFSIENYKESYPELLKLCSGNENILKNIFNGLVDKQSDIYSNPNNLKKVVNELIKNNNFDLEKIKSILGENSELNKYIQVEKKGENNEELSINNSLLINDFKNHYNELKQENISTTKEFAIESFLLKLGLGDSLGIEDGKLRKILGGILQFDYKKVEIKTISENKDLAWNYTSGKISKESYNQLFQDKYNKNLEKNGLSNGNNNVENTNNIINDKNTILENNNYDKNSGTIFINSTNGVDKIILTSEEKQLVKNNPKTIEKIVDFYLTLKDLGLSELWKEKEKIFTSISNKYGIGFNSKSENGTKVFLNSILKSVGQEKIDNTKSLTEFKNIFSNKNDLQIIGSGYKDNLLQKGSSKISEQFLQKYVIGKPYFDIDGFSKNI